MLLSLDRRDPENDKRICICMPLVVVGRFVTKMAVFLGFGVVLDTLRFLFLKQDRKLYSFA